VLAHIYPWFGLGLTIAICGAAFWKGGREEQSSAAALLLSLAATLALRDRSWMGIQWGAFASDILLLVFLVVLALRSKRYWPLCAAAFQLLCVVTHVARIVDPGVRAWAYATGQVIWSQAMMLALGVGVLNTWRAERQVARAAIPAGTPGATRR
jgi:hypothetical protein